MKMQAKNWKRRISMVLVWALLFVALPMDFAGEEVRVAMATEATEPTATQDASSEQGASQDSQPAPKAAQSTPEPQAQSSPEPQAQSSSEPEAQSSSEPEAETTVEPQLSLLAANARASIPVSVNTKPQANYGEEACVEYDFGDAPASDYLELLNFEVTKDGSPYAGARTSIEGSKYTLYFAEVGTYTVKVEAKDEGEMAPTFDFGSDSEVTVQVLVASVPITLRLASRQYNIDDLAAGAAVSVASTWDAPLEVELVATYGEQRVELGTYTIPANDTISVPLNLGASPQLGSWQIEAKFVSEGENFQSIYPVSFTLEKKTISYPGVMTSYSNSQRYNGGNATQAYICFTVKSESGTSPTMDDYEIHIQRNGEPYTPREGECTIDYQYNNNQIKVSPHLPGVYTFEVQLRAPASDYYVLKPPSAEVWDLTILPATPAYTVTVDKTSLNPLDSLKATVEFVSDLAWSEIQSNGSISATAYFVRDGLSVPWKDVSLPLSQKFTLEGPLPAEVGAGE